MAKEIQKIELTLPICIKKTANSDGFIITDANGTEHYFYEIEAGSKEMEYDGNCMKVEQNNEVKGLNFSEVLIALKSGKKATRKGWNGQGMFCYLVPAQEFPSLTKHAKEIFGEYTPYRAYLALKTAQNDIACWTPSTSDILAEDWVVLD